MKRYLITLLGIICLICSCEKPETTITEGSPEFSGQMTVLYEGEEFLQNDIKIQVEFDQSKSTVDIMLKKVKFVPAMPVKLDISILKVPVTLQDDGSWKISGDDIIPWAMGGPYDAYRVDDLKGTLTDTTCEFSLGFYNTKKQANYPTSYSGVLQ